MGKVKTEVTFIEKNGRTLSQRTEYHENGQVAQIGTYVNGLNVWSWNVPFGPIKSYFDNGNLKSEVVYDQYGALDGESSFYDKDGKLIKKKAYSQDVLLEEVDFENSTDNL